MNDKIIFIIIFLLLINLLVKKYKEKFTNEQDDSMALEEEIIIPPSEQLLINVKSRIDALTGVNFRYIRDFIQYIKILQTQNIKIDGDFTINGAFNQLPQGTIIMFNSTTPPKYWALCDGSTIEGYKTPDLRGKFIRMWNVESKPSKPSLKETDIISNVVYNNKWSSFNSSTSNGKIYDHILGDTGGTDIFALTSEKYLPSHNHTVDTNKHAHGSNLTIAGDGWDSGGGDGRLLYDGGIDNNRKGYTSTSAGGHTHNISSVGSGQEINNQPPYYVLTYIIRYK